MRFHRPALLGLAVDGVLAAGAATTTADPSDPAHLAYKTHNAEQIKTLPIERNASRSPKALISLPPAKAGAFRAGDMVWAQGEYEMTIC